MTELPDHHDLRPPTQQEIDATQPIQPDKPFELIELPTAGAARIHWSATEKRLKICDDITCQAHHTNAGVMLIRYCADRTMHLALLRRPLVKLIFGEAGSSKPAAHTYLATGDGLNRNYELAD